MKLTGKLKTQVDNAPTKEEKREAIKKAGMLLSDAELDQVAGGVDFFKNCFSCHFQYGDFECKRCPAYRG